MSGSNKPVYQKEFTMFADPMSVTVNAIAQSLPRVGASIDAGKFRSADGVYTLSISHSAGRRAQHRVRLDSNKISTDPYNTERNLPVSISAYAVLDVPLIGYTEAEKGQILTALADAIKASTFVSKFVGGES